MADVGRLVTDEEVRSFIDSVKDPFTKRDELLIKGVEKKVEKYCKRVFSLTTYTDESQDILPGEIRYNQQIIAPRLQFRLRHFPVKTFTSLKQVTNRSATTGAVSDWVLIPRDAYYVEPLSGVVNLLKTISAYTSIPLMGSGTVTPLPSLLTSWPIGVNVLLATYEAGYESGDTELDELKLIILKVLFRLWKRTDTQSLDVEAITGEFGTTSFLKVELTDDEKKDLAPYRKWTLGG